MDSEEKFSANRKEVSTPTSDDAKPSPAKRQQVADQERQQRRREMNRKTYHERCVRRKALMTNLENSIKETTRNNRELAMKNLDLQRSITLLETQLTTEWQRSIHERPVMNVPRGQFPTTNRPDFDENRLNIAHPYNLPLFGGVVVPNVVPTYHSVRQEDIVQRQRISRIFAASSEILRTEGINQDNTNSVQDITNSSDANDSTS